MYERCVGGDVHVSGRILFCDRTAEQNVFGELIVHIEFSKYTG